MTTPKPTSAPTKKKQPWLTPNRLVVLIGLIVMSMLFYAIQAYGGEQGNYVFYQVLIPLLAGIIYENRRLNSKWHIIALKFLGALLFSLFALAGGADKPFDEIVEFWMYFFVFVFLKISIVYHGDKVVPRLTEGITLMQCIALIYWAIDVVIFQYNSLFAYLLMATALFFVLLTTQHAFTYRNLSRSTRWWLSLWSSLMMLLFAGDYLYHFLSPVETVFDSMLLTQCLAVLQYFLLGISLMYILQNLNMIIGYLPSRGSSKASHKQDIRELNKQHIKRFSKIQTNKSDAWLAVCFGALLCGWNYHYRFVSRPTLIWLMFWSFPLILTLKYALLPKQKAKTA
jgi:hypothetical protein